MSDEEFKKEVKDLVEMLDNLHQIRDRNLTKWLKREIRAQMVRILREH